MGSSINIISISFPVPVLSQLMVVMIVQMLMLHHSVAEVDVSASPDQIDVGLSPSLDINCTFSMGASSPMVEIISLTLSRGNNTQLASITTFSDHHVSVISTSEGITADGVINPGGQSYIHLHWEYPRETQEGTYQCMARGLDLSGQNVETVNISVVSANQPDIQDLLEKLRQMEQTQILFTQNFINATNQIQQMQVYINQMEDRLSFLETKNDNQMMAAFLLPPLTYNNTQYYVSRNAFQDINDTITICKAYGGIMVEINDLDEYHAIQDYLLTAPRVYRVYLGATDEGHAGTWVLRSTNETLPVSDWFNPDDATYGFPYNCLTLTRRGDEWKMYALYCHYDRVDNTNITDRYMCEISAGAPH